MNSDELKERIANIFSDTKYEWQTLDVKVQSRKDYIHVEVSRMYDFVTWNYSHLKKLSELFGTEKIDVDNWSAKGCETCDHGSTYAVTFQVYESKHAADVF
jgi:hypothetical protein